MNRRTTRRAVLAVTLATASAALANDLYWQGGTASLGSASYFDATIVAGGVTPNATDIARVGADGVAGSAADLSLGRLVVGHNTNATGAPGATAGSGTVNVTAGTLTLTLGGSNANASVIVGNNHNGTLNIDNATVSAFQVVQVGYGNDLTRSATLNITNNGRLDVSAGALNVGEGSGTNAVGVPGFVNVNGTLNVAAALNVGQRSGASSFTQTGGTTTIGAGTNVGRTNADGSSFNLSGGTFTTANVFSAATGSVDDGYSDDVSVNLTGGTLNTGRGFVIATGAARNTTLNVSNNAVLNVTNNLAIADHNGTADKTIFNLSGNAQVTVGIDAFLGRGNSTNTTLNMTGGSIAVVGNFVAADSGNGTFTASVVANHSAGPITTGGHFVLATTEGDATHNLSGTGSITTTGMVVVGRQAGAGIMNQTGGTVTANAGVGVGYQVAVTGGLAADAALNATGTYNISGGALVATAASPADALSVAAQGTGTFRVIGDDATITVNGNVGVYANTFGTNTGTLAFQLEAGDPGLSRVNATGTATFTAGSVLSLDFAGLTPAASSFDLLTAADIVDNGLVFSAPTGWSFEIVPGGNGELLRALSSTPVGVAGDVNGDGVVNLGDINYVTARWLNAGPAGDANKDGVVNLGDINYITARWLNTSEPGGVSVAALAAVPEPASLSLVALSTLPLLSRRRRA